MLPLNDYKIEPTKQLMVESFLKPFSSNHSIREAVISVFLATPIIKPERFQKLIQEGFVQDFQLYENVNSVEIELKALTEGAYEQKSQNLGNVGFKFIGFNEGKVSRIIQGVNEKSRTFISYHSFVYKRWDDFLDEYLRFMKILSSVQNDLFINAVSIHYVDQFKWISNSPINLAVVFNDKAKYMSKAFLESTGPTNFIFTTQKNDDNFVYIDRLEIKIDDKKSRDITISHNITKQLDDFKNLDSLLQGNSEYFMNILAELHKYNKLILSDILNSEVKRLINLPIESI